MKRLLLAAALALFAWPALGASGIVYIDTGGCNTGSTTQCSGTTDSATASASGAAATITCSATSGPASAPGCSISGSAGQLAAIPVDGSQAVYVDCATNTAQKIFWINAVDDGAGLVGTTVTPTGCTAATSDWGIGGRWIFPGGSGTNVIEAALRPLDIVQFNNTPATRTARYFTASMATGSNAGYIFVRGKAGVRPVLEVTTNIQVITNSVNTLSKWSNLEIKGLGTVLIDPNTSVVYDDIKFSAGSLGAFNNGNNNITIRNSEFTGFSGSSAVITSSGTVFLTGNNFHGNTTSGAAFRSTSATGGDVILRNIFSNNSGQAILFNGTATSVSSNILISGNVVYGNGNSGLEVTDADYTVNLYNNIFLDNGNTGTEYNVEYTSGNIDNRGSHGCNVFSIAGGTGGGNVLGLTVNATESTSNPGFTNAAGGDFSITGTSPASATGCPNTWLGGSSTGYLDMGAVQHQASSPGGSRNDVRPGMN
jgi:hypothetical protein